MDRYYLQEAVDFVCDVLEIVPPKIRSSMLIKDRGKTARYYIDNNIGRLFLDIHSFTDPRQFYFTIFHEVFHHYQAIACDRYKSLIYIQTNLNVDVPRWNEELGVYKSNGVEGYDDQYLEIDANAFGMYMMKVIWNLDVPYNPDVVDINKIIRYINIIKEVITPEIVLGLVPEYDLLDLRNNQGL